MAKLGAICELVNGYAFKPTDWSEEGLPIIRIQNLNDNNAPFNYYNGEIDDKYYVKDGDLLFAWSGTPGTSFGAFFWKRGKGILNQHIFNVYPVESINKEYFRYALNGNLDMIISKAHGGVGLKHITKKELENIDIPIPPLETQHKIAANLDKVTHTIDLCNAILEKLDLLVKSRFVEMFGDLMYNPNKWSVYRISDVSTFLKSGLSRKLSDQDIGMPCIRSCNIQNGQFDYSDIKYWYIDDPQGANTNDYILKDGDILINFINSNSQIGKVCIFSDVNRDCIYTTNIFRMKLNEKCNKHYFNYYAMTEYYKRQLQNIIQPAVNQSSFTTVNFLKLSIPVPPMELQNQFAAFVERTDKSKLAVKQVLEKAETLKKALMQEYFG